MANHNLFLKSGFIKAPLENGLGRYIGQLQRITIKFCKNHGSSKGVREFIENDLVNFAKENPGVVIYVKPRRHRSPVLVGEFLNGDRTWMSLRKLPSEDITKWLELKLTQAGDTAAIRYRKHWHTDVPSIQGAWTPFTHQNPMFSIAKFPDTSLGEKLNMEKTATEKLLELFSEQQQQQIQSTDAEELSKKE